MNTRYEDFYKSVYSNIAKRNNEVFTIRAEHFNDSLEIMDRLIRNPALNHRITNYVNREGSVEKISEVVCECPISVSKVAILWKTGVSSEVDNHTIERELFKRTECAKALRNL